MKKILILGSAGLVGMNLLSVIYSKVKSGRYSVTAIDKNTHNLNVLREVFPKVNIVRADLSKFGSWDKEFEGIDVVIQLQAQIASPIHKKFVDNNITSVKNVLKACQKYGVKNLIHLSSSVVISVANDDYTNTKKEGEKLVVNGKIPYTILRPPLMYGAFDAKHLGWITRFMKKTPLIFPIPGNGKYLRQPLFVLDMAKILSKLIEMPRDNKVHNVIGKERLYYIDLLKIISKERKIRRLFIKIPIPIFIFLMNIYGAIFRTKPFIPEQLYALTAGDDFPVNNWDTTFKVKYTPFKEAIKKTIASPYDEYSARMENPN